MQTILTMLIIVSGVVCAQGQGTVDFRNGGITFRTVADRRVYVGAGCSVPLVGTNYVAGLYYMAGANAPIDAPTAGTQAGALAHFRQPTTTRPGIWLNPTDVGNTRILDGVIFGQTATIQIRVWDSSKYSSYADAFAHGASGASAPFNYTVPQPGDLSPDAYYMDNLRAFGGFPCPEPSTAALLAVSAIAWLWLRRKGRRDLPF